MDYGDDDALQEDVREDGYADFRKDEGSRRAGF